MRITRNKPISKVLFAYFMIDEEPGSGKEKSLLRLAHGAPMGLKYLSAVLLKERGIKSNILDQRVERFKTELLHERFTQGDYDLLGIYLCTDPVLEEKAAGAIREFRKHSDAPVIAGGPPFNTRPILEAGCDMICHSEGERTILDMLDCAEGKMQPGMIKGISFLENGELIRNPDRGFIEDLDSLPYPIHDPKTINKYFALGNPTAKLPSFAIISSRGCPNNCGFCNTKEMWGSKVRTRSCDNVIGEIEQLVHDFGARYISFSDDIFGAKSSWLIEFCEKLIVKKLPVNWVCHMHPLHPAKNSDKIIPLMAKAGCRMLHFGIQSGDPEILRRSNRNPKELEMVKEKLRIAKKHGILTYADFIIGLPGESRESINKSLRFAMEARPALVGVFSLGVLPKTDVDMQYAQKGVPITELTRKEIDNSVRKFRKIFLLNPRNIAYIVYYILTHNIRWLLISVRFIPAVFSIAGVGKPKKTF